MAPTIDGATIAEEEREAGRPPRVSGFDLALRTAPWLICASAFFLGIAMLPLLPDMVASHWDASGNVNGYMPKLWGAFLLPLILLVLVALLEAIPLIDPLKANIESFRVEYDGLVVAMSLFMFTLYAWTIAWSFGFHIDSNVILPIGMGLLFIYVGFVLTRAKRNYMVGIRTPWTLASDEVWDRTHHLGGVLFAVAGVVTMLGAFASQFAMWFLLLPLLVVTVWTTAYSYVLFRRLEREGKLPSTPQPM